MKPIVALFEKYKVQKLHFYIDAKVQMLYYTI